MTHPGSSDGTNSPAGPNREDDDFFGEQPTARSLLPDPEPLLINLARCVLEVLAGARELEQLARWISDEAYRHLLTRVVLADRARAITGQPALRPLISVGRVIITEPTDGVIEAVVITEQRGRVHAVAVRLEGIDKRWRASAIHVV